MSLNILNQVEQVKVDNIDHILGKGLQMPFNASNSGSRKLMFGTQLEHRLPLLKPEVPFIQTGYEMEFGKNSSSYITVDEDMEVIGCVSKFSDYPTHHFYLFALSEKDQTLHVFERKEYKHVTENYGYLLDNSKIDTLVHGGKIPEGTIIQKSIAFDEYDNRMDGCNLLTMYAACEKTMEDAIVISESAAKKLASPLVKKVSIVINDNDIPLNLYGDNENYKTFPDIGENVKNSILCGLRRKKKEEALYTQAYSRLKELSISDERYTVSGKVVDIDVYCNSPQSLEEYAYNVQIKKYYNDMIRMYREIVEILSPFVNTGYKMDYDLQRLYSIANGCLNGKQYYADRAFSNIILEITLVEEIDVAQGDKLSNRYGGKGITAKVNPDALMPKTENGETIDVILNMCGVYGRENAGQLFEITVSYISMKLIEYFNTDLLDVGECIKLYLELLEIVSPSMKEYMEEFFDSHDDDECMNMIYMVMASEKSLYLAIEPMSENMTIDKVAQLYDKFSWIEPEYMLMPVTDSTGKIRYVHSRRPMIYGYQYIYRLKQYAEEKFSVTSLSATNVRNENSKSKSSNNYKSIYARTPIRFGNMETGNLIHLGAELVVQMLMIYSTSPHARRLTESLLTGDAFDVDIKLDMESKNRNVEILNAYFKSMGLRLEFSKHPKKAKPAMTIYPMSFRIPPDSPAPNAFTFFNKNEKLDYKEEAKRHIKQRDTKLPMIIYPMRFFK